MVAKSGPKSSQDSKVPPTTDNPNVGRVLANRYELGELLGQGSHGTGLCG